jgi:hypothetical protein
VKLKLALIPLLLAVAFALVGFAPTPAYAVEMDCKPGASTFSTLSAFNNGQVFEARTCTERATSGPNEGAFRGHTKVRCRLGTYGPDSNDECNIIYGDVTINLYHYDAFYGYYVSEATAIYTTGTYNDTSEDYYTPWVCPNDGEPGIDHYRTITNNLQAQSSSGQVGSDHNHDSYIAEANTGCPV